jgi:hypothetical protein
MKLAPILAVLLALGLAQPAAAQWRDPQGKPLPQTPAMQSKDGFSAMVIVTDDAKWKEKLQTPEADTPRFREVREVHLGGTLHILTAFAGMGIDAEGKAHIECSAEMKLPDGSVARSQPWIACGDGEVKGAQNSVRLLPLQLAFTGEESDPEGVYPVVIRVRDKVRGVELELKSDFTYRKKK